MFLQVSSGIFEPVFFLLIFSLPFFSVLRDLRRVCVFVGVRDAQGVPPDLSLSEYVNEFECLFAFANEYALFNDFRAAQVKMQHARSEGRGCPESRFCAVHRVCAPGPFDITDVGGF